MTTMRRIAYCRNCGRGRMVDQEKPDPAPVVCVGCGQINWRDEDEEEPKYDWTLGLNDRRFLRSIRIAADDDVPATGEDEEC